MRLTWLIFGLCLLSGMPRPKKYFRPKLVTTQHGNFAETESNDIQITSMTSTNKDKMTKPHSTTVSVKSTSTGKNILMQQFTISLYLAAMMLANSCDIELNPGPPAKFPCGVCAKPVKWTDRGICCDSCQKWYHISCQCMSTQMYNTVGASNISWECLNCGIPNFSSGIFDTFNLSTYNPYTALSLSDSDQSQMDFSIDTNRSFGSPITSSSPKPHALTKTKSRSPFYNVHRKDRLDNRGGGVFLAIDSIHARAIIGRKRGQAGIGTKLVGVKLLNTLQQVSKLTSTN